MLSLLVLLTGQSTQAATASQSSTLIVDSMEVRGNLIAQMNQSLCVYVRNESATDSHQGCLYLLAPGTEADSYAVVADTLVSLAPHDFNELRLLVRLPEGQYTLLAATDPQGKKIVGGCVVDIAPLRELRLHADLIVGMLTTTGEERLLYDNKQNGTVILTPNDIYNGCHSKDSGDDGVLLWLEDKETGKVVEVKHLLKEFDRNQVKLSFSFAGELRLGGSYVLKAGYVAPDGWKTVSALDFTVHAKTNTYWTADGQVLPLPQEYSQLSQKLRVPAEAVAVDLRGINAINTIFSIDTSQANPNCLYYLDLMDYTPSGLDDSRNIIRDGQAEHIVLTEGHDYLCPQAFKADFISYLLTPSYDNANDLLRSQGYSETLVLPFNVSDASFVDINGKQEMLHADMLEVLEYMGTAADSVTVAKLGSVHEMKAYVPYILGTNINSRLLFIGEATNVPSTRQAIALGNHYNFIGTTVGVTLTESSFQYLPSANSFCQTSQARVAPFRAYLEGQGDGFSGTGQPKPSDSYTSLLLKGFTWDTPTSVSAIPIGAPSRTSATGRQVAVYALSGQFVKTVDEALLRQGATGLKPGVYIVNNKKVIVN